MNDNTIQNQMNSFLIPFTQLPITCRSNLRKSGFVQNAFHLIVISARHIEKHIHAENHVMVFG